MSEQKTYIPRDHGHLPCDNDRCRGCTYYSWNTVSCDYYLRTGLHRRGPAEDCPAYRDRRLISARRYRILYGEKVKS